METEKKKKIRFNPLDVTESLGYQTFRKGVRKLWSKEEDGKLTELIDVRLRAIGVENGIQGLTTPQWCTKSADVALEINWEEISSQIQTKKSKECRKRWTSSLDPNLKKGKWTPEEDELLLATFQKYGTAWQKVSLEIAGRTDDQCAKRYNEVLDPNTKDRLRTWSLEEDLNLIRKVKSYGTKWRTISSEMKSRPSLTCRNRWRKLVTDVVRGKANPAIKKEIDSIEGGLSKIEEISENLQSEKKRLKEKKEKLKQASEEPDSVEEQEILTSNNNFTNQSGNLTQGLTQKSQQSTSIERSIKTKIQSQESSHDSVTRPHTLQSQASSHLNPNPNQRLEQQSNSFLLNHHQRLAQISQNQSPNSNLNYSNQISQPTNPAQSYTNIDYSTYNGNIDTVNDISKPTSTAMDWKFTLKDTSGLTVSNGNISSSDLARDLIENAKKFNLKISIHQHIHHHYAQTNSNSKTTSPDDSASNVSGNYVNDEIVHPNRYSHFNYLPPMAQPQLQSSGFGGADNNEFTKILNPTGHQYKTSSSKRRLSNSSGNHREKITTSQHHFQPNYQYQQQVNCENDAAFNQEDLEDELDFWETMRSLSQVVNPGQKERNGTTSHHANTNGLPSSSKTRQGKQKTSKEGFYYTNEFIGEEDPEFEELEDNLKDLGGFADGLPFNPS